MIPGTTIGHYHILRPLGAGGMGEVFLATDTKLKREVALKILPEAVRDDPERLRRFRVEAEAAAKLNHPNIATVYSIEEADNQTFITMEHVDGKTLSDHIPSDGIDVDQFFEWFIPITDALAHAHKHGRIHRDLKPGNIMIRTDGVPIILDFGLARIEREAQDDSEAPTLTMGEPETQGRSFLGTPAYMSPEQIEGKQVDARTDLFSLGVLMYEAITGQRPFAGDTVESVTARILETEPKPITEIRPVTPYTLWTVIRKCLKKQSRQRLQTSEELHSDLRDIQQELHAGTVLVDASTIEMQAADIVEPATISFWRQPAALGLAFVMLVAGLGTAWLLKPVPEQPLRKFTIPWQWTGVAAQGPVISPDAKFVAYPGPDGLWLRNLNSLESHLLIEDQEIYVPFWSPDSDMLGYVTSARSLYKISVNDGSPTFICSIPDSLGLDLGQGAWGPNGTIVLSLGSSGLYSVQQGGGQLALLLAPDSDRGEISLYGLQFLPDGKTMLFDPRLTQGEAIEILSGTTRKTLLQQPGFLSIPSYSSSGHILYQKGWPVSDGIWALPFDLKNLNVTGEPFEVVSNGAVPSISADETLTFRVEAVSGSQIIRTTRNGTVVDTLRKMPDGQVLIPSLSKDGKYLASTVMQEDYNVWLYELTRGTWTPMTIHGATDRNAIWEPEGNRLAFMSRRNGGGNVFLGASNRQVGIEHLLGEPNDEIIPLDWSSDGKYLIYMKWSAKTGSDLWLYRFGEDPRSVPLLQMPYNEFEASISPDGDYFAYSSSESGRMEVYVTSFPVPSAKVTVSVGGGTAPRWSNAGDELFFVEGNTLMAVPVKSKVPLQFGLPLELFEGKSIDTKLVYRIGAYWTRNYDVAQDGKTLFVVQQIRNGNDAIAVVQNWYKEFEDRE
jgi:eukaryotic-like serine/threonine-protein kinase